MREREGRRARRSGGGEANTDENKNNYYDHNHKPLLVHHLTMEDNGKLYNKNIKRK